jgi:hypothetical protein
MSEPSPKFDLGALAGSHLDMSLNNVLTIWGLAAEVFETVIYENEYKEIAPEKAYNPVASKTIRILVGKVMQGFNVSGPFISLSDKFQNEVTIITNVKLNPDDKVTVTFSDDKKLSYRITLPEVINGYTQIFFAFKAVLQ